MASDDAVKQYNGEKSDEYETTSTDRSLLDFMKKDDQDESKVITTEFDDKLHVQECKVEQEQQEEKVTKPSLLQKLHRSGSSSSSSSEEEVEEGGEIKKKKKGLKEKIFHKEEDTSVPVQVVTEPEENKGLLEKIKDKLPGGGDNKVDQDHETVAPQVDNYAEGGEPANKGIMEKIKEKMPGYHPKTTSEEDKKQNDCT